MSSECKCYVNEWCFYCEMFTPLEDKLAAAEKERDEAKVIHSSLCNQIKQLEEKCEEHSRESDTYYDWWESTKKERNELRKRVEELEGELIGIMVVVDFGIGIGTSDAIKGALQSVKLTAESLFDKQEDTP